MVGLMQIMIYLLCAYLIFKGVEIFQIALVSPRDDHHRKLGTQIGVAMLIGAFVIGAIAIYLTESMAASMQKNIERTTNPFIP
ncbi:MAG: hypothetical protein AB7L70_19315 [Pyrinomonadaceae bacterium]